ncbi:MAG: hypothetical protein PHU99_07365 [Candidatus Cloacimonetes bacterium]|nr:hypothetical protein [Candidatus Cloacimonadota bacterium]MDD2544460.1 hypothetical protein [Candidatus Cloacimonadota bacterium]MDD2683815.1 hypothetical protein [Candidatus Cloacimonadota bacterium]MDD3097518.1 hypothetical protein [Candidatus Cloacimonadota bacterium]MDY0337732.1 hypothetical protein [Candidatus Cloacimonadaceae bacterium]
MRFWLGLLTLLLLLSSCFVSSSLVFTEADIENSMNLVHNPSFAPYSLRGEEALKGWNVIIEPHSNDFNKILIDNKVYLDGNTSLRIDASDKDVMIISEPFEVRRYGGYYARIKARTDSEEAPQINLRMITFKEQGKITNRFQHKTTVGKEWELISTSAGFLRPGVNFGRVFIHIPPFSEGSIWLDDAGCWEVHGFRID